METRPYFIAGDLFSNALVGALAAWAAASLVAPGWPMLPAMFAAMAVGMALAMALCFFALVPLFGAMEVMLPCMFGGMLAAMGFGMVAADRALTASEALLGGAAVGIGALLFCWLFEAWLGWRRNRG